jgi:hypothetical protein
MSPADEYAVSNGFTLKLGRWDFIYAEGDNRFTVPVEMLMDGDYSLGTWTLKYKILGRCDERTFSTR